VREQRVIYVCSLSE